MAALAEISTLVGKINAAWNDVQFFVYLIFIHLMNNDILRSEAIFFSLKSDSAQRDITLAVAKVSLAREPDMLSKVVAHFGAVGKKAGRRNDAIHGMFNLNGPNYEPAVAFGSSPRLADKPLKSELERSLVELKALSRETAHIYQAVSLVEIPLLEMLARQAKARAANPEGNTR
jgi:hypothetical protein